MVSKLKNSDISTKKSLLPLSSFFGNDRKKKSDQLQKRDFRDFTDRIPESRKRNKLLL